MNIWTQKSIELANQSNYLDLLYKVYPISANAQREMSDDVRHSILKSMTENNDEALLGILLEQTRKSKIVFPLKDSYVAFLRHDRTAISRNPATVERLTGALYEMGYEELIKKATAPKETNRQIGPLFGDWVRRGSLCRNLTDDFDTFLNSKENIIFDGNDAKKAEFAQRYLGYTRNKGLDFLAKFNNKFVIGEAKFLSDFGGSQNSDFEDAELTLRATLSNSPYEVIKIAIIDGVIYIDSKSGDKMSRKMRNNFNDNEVIISAVLLRDFLYTL